MITRGIDHVALTVPDMDQATLFFKKAFDAKIAYDLHKETERPLEGEDVELSLGLPKGGQLIHMRMLSIGNSASIELFNYRTSLHQRAAHTYDYGLQHVAFYVDDIDSAAQRFQDAGGTLYTGINQIFGDIEGTSLQNRYVYGEMPWGTVVELVTYPTPINYPSDSEANRFTPTK